MQRIEDRRQRIEERGWKLSCLSSVIRFLIISFLCIGTVGCALTGSSKSKKFLVIPVSSRDVITLNSDDVVRVMRRAGFSDEQILELGTRFRNALLVSGAVEIKRGKVVEAIFWVNDNNVFVTARLRGTFIYDVTQGSWVRLGIASRQSQPIGAPTERLQTSPEGSSGVESYKYPRSILPTIPDTQYQGGSIWQRE